jgi:S-adenosylmethionine-diacylgycerolhomoserine-N-methlytransferase
LNATRAEHRAFLNRVYGLSKLFYDATRKYFLFGRDAVLRGLAGDRDWVRLAEIGPGTGRNLAILHRARPDAMLAGVEACDAMLAHARARCPWASIEQGFAEDMSLQQLFGARPDRILFSYCLSMVTDPTAALENARRSLADGGQVVVVDFADFAEMPSVLARAFRAYLRAFRVEPLEERVLSGATSVRFGPGRYYVVAAFADASSG